MSTQPPHSEEPAGRKDASITGLGAQIYDCLVGIDSEGCQHFFHKSADMVVVYDGRELDSRHDLDGASIGSYVQFVARTREWTEMGSWYGLLKSYHAGTR